MRALLDVNVLIALLDAEHLHHEAARRWFEGQHPTWMGDVSDHSKRVFEDHGANGLFEHSASVACRRTAPRGNRNRSSPLLAQRGGRFVTFDAKGRVERGIRCRRKELLLDLTGPEACRLPYGSAPEAEYALRAGTMDCSPGTGDLA